MKMKDIMSAQREEMLRHKWIESEKAGHDLVECPVSACRDDQADISRDVRHFLNCIACRLCRIDLYPETAFDEHIDDFRQSGKKTPLPRA